ncbi:hypothetical protein [Pyxidicoccus xibeiensis]|uniref:hypothetical protein n=1 Tax=Pyxidicoccus xibeiensis TaxID=2906759 RepID=UPI0020A78C6E|nr:hypothetical protein [Pyxidicoccus xibeiensis]MCP3145003.1 hypothetical protein [Pyxidicoccus xibeiensis]
MEPEEIYAVLRGINVTHLHHANSVRTSCSFLQQGGLLSRSFAEHYNLPQTPQPMSDELDKKFGIWHCLFLDHVDIHERGGRKKGPNKYGPVLFVFEVDVLLKMPPETKILVTKSNPIHWSVGQSNADRWFLTQQEVAANLNYGAFDKMLVIQTPSQKIDFPNRSATIFVDDPQRQVSSGADAYAHAESQLRAAAAAVGVAASIDQHSCRSGCICVDTYARYPQQTVDFFFT